MRAALVLAIRLYQRYLSPRKGFCCAYRVHTGRRSCSELGLRAVRRFGAIGGMRVLTRRFELCGVAHRRFSAASRPRRQRGSLDCGGCDLPCDADCSPDLDCRARRLARCCEACPGDCGSGGKKKPPFEDRVHLPAKAQRKSSRSG